MLHSFTKAMAIMTAAAMTLLPVYPAHAQQGGGSSTKTPIKHVVVIFQENVSFDHYFGTYPHAFNLPGETPFHAKENTLESNTLLSSGLLTNNPNKANPFRIPPSVPVTCDEDHNYGDEQAAANGGLMDKFVEKLSCNDAVLGPASTMGYYDGNTVTALWNYAQHFSMSDNSFSTGYGPSSPGALNLVSGNTFGAICGGSSTINAPKCATEFSTANQPGVVAPQGPGTVFGDDRPWFDNCDTTQSTAEMGGQNVGDLLNDRG